MIEMLWALPSLALLAILSMKYVRTLSELKIIKEVVNEHTIYSRTDADGRITAVNKKFERVSGYSHDELIGKTHSIINSHYHHDVFFERMWNTISSGKKWSGMIRNRAKNGQIYWVKSTIIPTVGIRGNVNGYVAMRTEMDEIQSKGYNPIDVVRLLDFVEDELVVFDFDTLDVIYTNQGLQSGSSVSESNIGHLNAIDVGLEDNIEAMQSHLSKMSQSSLETYDYTTSKFSGTKNETRRFHRLAMHVNEYGSNRVIAVSRDITDEARLRLENQQLGDQIEKMGVPFFVYDATKERVVYCNEAMAILYGYSKPEIYELSLFDLRETKGNTSDLNRELFRKTENENGLAIYSVEHIRKDGTTFICNASIGRTTSQGEGIYVGTIEDATERLRTQESSMQYSAVLDILEDEIYLVAADSSKFLYLNAKARQRLEEGTDYRKLTPGDLFGTFDIEAFRQVTGPLLEGKKKTHLTRVSMPGIPFAEMSVQAFNTESSGPVLINQIRDITDRVSFESQMAMLRIAVRASEDVISVIDPKTLKFDYLNLAGRQMIDENEEATLHSLFPKIDIDRFQEIFERLLNTPNESEAIEFQTEKGRFMEVKMKAIFIVDETKVLAIARDVTFRKDIDRRKRQFMAVVSHELRTPITAIKGALSILSTEAVVKKPETARELINIAKTSSEKLARLINDIVDMEKITEGKFVVEMKPFELSRVVEQAVEENQTYASQFGTLLKVVKSEPNAWILGDSLRMGQVLDNLISNAVKYSGEGQEVHIAVSAEPTHYRISVRDFGDGMPSENLDEIFGAFYQIGRSDSSKVRGSGLGLAIVKQLVESHHGVVDVTSKIGEGTEFTVVVPKLDAGLIPFE